MFNFSKNNWTMLDGSIDIHEDIKPAIYYLGINQFGQLVGSESPIPTLPPKIYGSLESKVSRVMATNESQAKKKKNFGMLFAGQKGDGKTLLANMIILKMKEMGYPIFILDGDSKVPRSLLVDLFERINRRGVLYVDEFEKVFPRQEDQNEYLSLLDGGSTNNMVSIFTINDMYKISEFMYNRPSRIRYLYEFRGVEQSAIVDYAIDRGLSKEHAEKILTLSSMFEYFSFDQLSIWVEECVLYNEDPSEALKVLNLRPYISNGFSTYTATIFYNDIDVTHLLKPIKRLRNPLTADNWSCFIELISVDSDSDEDSDEENNDEYPFIGKNFYLRKDHLVGARNADTLIFSNPDIEGVTFVLTKETNNTISYLNAI